MVEVATDQDQNCQLWLRELAASKLVRANRNDEFETAVQSASTMYDISEQPQDEVEKSVSGDEGDTEHAAGRSYQEVSTEKVSSLPDFLMSIPAGRGVPSASSCTNTNWSHTKDLKLSAAAANGSSATLPSFNSHTKANPNSADLTKANAISTNLESMSSSYNNLSECMAGFHWALTNPPRRDLVQIGLSFLILGDWRTAAIWHHRVAEQLMDNVEGYPVFLPARGMSQEDYAQILRFLRRLSVEEQLAVRLRNGRRQGAPLGR
ncbi:hypothetical protein BJ742DRAFT_859040 [Cladochytrium replicatum]|nr:hypothetical protein BJ742DRAFT_859040 [Cladochytrium replicatum]